MRQRWYRKAAAALLCAIGMALALGGCGEEKQTLLIGIDPTFPPYSYKDENGDFIGFDVELAKAVCELEGWEAKPVPINWDEKDTMLNDGSIDCVWSGFTMNDRENDYTLSDAYCDNSVVVAVPVSSDIEDIAGLEKRVVGVQAATSGADYLTSNQDGKSISATFRLLSQFSDIGDAFAALEDGTVEAVVADVKVAEHFVRDGGCRILDEALVEEQYGVAMKKGNTKLCETINADLKKLAEDGTMKKLAEKYGIEDSICMGDD